MPCRSYDAIAIGVSAGALETLTPLLTALPKDYALPIIVVVHLPANQKSMFAELLKPRCQIDVREVEDKEPVNAGTIYIAPPDYHLQVESSRTFSLSNDEPILFSRPCIDVLFDTAAETYRERLIGVILTGASSDGALGLKAVMEAGGTGLVQNPRDAFSSAMPLAALEQCPKAQVMSLQEITHYLQKAGIS